MKAVQRKMLFYFVFCALFGASAVFSFFNLAKVFVRDQGQFRLSGDYFGLFWACVFACIAYQSAVMIKKSYNRLRYVAKHVLISGLEAEGYKWDIHDVYWLSQETEIGIHIGIRYIVWKVTECEVRRLADVMVYKKDDMAVLVDDIQMLLFVHETLP